MNPSSSSTNNRSRPQFSSISSLNASNQTLNSHNTSTNSLNQNETDGINQRRMPRSSELGSSKLYREITLEMIDDFLNPLSKKSLQSSNLRSLPRFNQRQVVLVSLLIIIAGYQREKARYHHFIQGTLHLNQNQQGSLT